MVVTRGIGELDAPRHPVPLDRKPRAVTYSVEELMQAVRDGRVRVPEFQRPLRWELEDRKRLFDSILRGYPIGTMLFWKRRAAAQRVSLGPLEIPAPELTDALWVVDGQQRLTALAGALLTPVESAADFALFFDLDTEDFLPKSRTRGRTVIPLEQVLDSERLLSWLFKRGATLNDLQRNRALRLGKAVREYTVPAYEVVSDDEQVPREIFARLNSSGKRMDEHEVFDALHGARGAVPGSLREIADEVDAMGFGRPDENIILRSAKAVLALDITKDISQQALPRDTFSRTARAVSQAVVFLQRDVRIPRYELLPYKLPLATLARFFALHAEPIPRSRELLARWVWRGAISGRHRGDTTATRTVLEAIDEKEEASVQRLLSQVDRGEPFSIETQFDFRHASSKLQALALLELAPRNLADGEVLSLASLFSGERDDVPIRKIREDTSELGRSIANRLIHPRVIGGLAQTLAEVSAEVVLQSHGIPADAHIALKSGNYTRFLELRWQYLALEVERFLDSRARWAETDRPSLDALRVADGDDD